MARPATLAMAARSWTGKTLSRMAKLRWTAPIARRWRVAPLSQTMSVRAMSLSRMLPPLASVRKLRADNKNRWR